MAVEIDLLAYLQTKGIFPKYASADEVHTQCWWHGEAPGERGRLYINVGSDSFTQGLYQCKVCREKGNLRTLLRYFGDESLLAEDEGSSHNVHQILQAATEFYHSNLEPRHIRYLREERGLSAATIQKHKFGYADGKLFRHLSENGFDLKDMRATGLVAVREEAETPNALVLGGVKGTGKPYDFLRDCITIPYQVSGNTVQIRGKQMDGKYLTPPRQEARLFNTDSVWHTDQVLICEGEFDAIVAEQMGFAAVGVPGAGTWQDRWDSYMDGMRRIYTVFDNDSAGNLGASALKEKFGTPLRVVEMPLGEREDGTVMDPGENDVSEYFGKQKHTKEELSALLDAANRKGTLLITPYQAYEEWLDLQGKQGFRYGFEELDAYLAPGLIDGQVCVPLAKTNVGKTLFLLNIFQRASMVKGQEDDAFLFHSMEQTRGDWFERERRIWNFYNLNCPSQDVNSESLKYWDNRIRITDVNRMAVDELYGAIADFRDEMGKNPSVVAIDYLGYWARTFKGLSKYEAVTEAVMTLKQVAKDEHVRIIAPGQVSRTQDFGKKLDVDSGRDSGAIEETADSVFLLYNPDTASAVSAEERSGQIHCGIGKSRSGGKGREMVMQFGYLTLVMVPLTDVKYSGFAADELSYDLTQDSGQVVAPWEAAIFRHRTGQKNGSILDALKRERLGEADDDLFDPDDF